ncbi:hypothetical protein [Streptomyces sp. NPDC018352]
MDAVACVGEHRQVRAGVVIVVGHGDATCLAEVELPGALSPVGG